MSLRHLAAPALLLAHRLFSARRDGLRVLMLHDVPPGEVDALDEMVGTLARQGRLADPAQAAALLAEGGPGQKVLLSFDDGFASNREAARSVLDRHGAKALFFVCPGLIDLPVPEQAAAVAANVFRGRLKDSVPALMGWDGIEALARSGHAIGNHTLTHRRLPTLTEAEIEDEIAGGAAELTRRLGAAPAWFAYPFGDIDSVDARVLAAAARHHRFCRSGVRGLNRAGADPLAVLSDHVDLAAPAAYRWLAAEGGLERRYGAQRARLATLAANVLDRPGATDYIFDPAE